MTVGASGPWIDLRRLTRVQCILVVVFIIPRHIIVDVAVEIDLALAIGGASHSSYII
jgi:hypothetical protein